MRGRLQPSDYYREIGLARGATLSWVKPTKMAYVRFRAKTVDKSTGQRHILTTLMPHYLLRKDALIHLFLNKSAGLQFALSYLVVNQFNICIPRVPRCLDRGDH